MRRDYERQIELKIGTNGYDKLWQLQKNNVQLKSVLRQSLSDTLEYSIIFYRAF